MTELQIIKEATPHPLSWIETVDDSPQQHVIIFEKVATDDTNYI